MKKLLFIVLMLAALLVTPAVAFANDDISDIDAQAGSSLKNTQDDRTKAKAADIPAGGFERGPDGKWMNGYGTEVLDNALGRGIDVSYHQGRIDWEAVKASDIQFAILRCGYGSNWSSQDDDYWEYNVSECERLGIPYGVYLFSYAYTNADGSGDLKVLSEINHVKRLLHGHHPTLPVYYDLESERIINIEGEEFPNRAALKWCESISAAGYVPGIYANLNWWNNYLTDSRLDSYPRWVAEWNNTGTHDTRPFQIWQCASDYPASRIGITGSDGGYVDMNIAYAEYQPYTPGYWSEDESGSKVFMGYTGTCSIQGMPDGPVIETGEYDNDTVVLKNTQITADGKKYILDGNGHVIDSLDTAVIDLEKDRYTYTGNSIRPDVKVTIDGYELTKGTEYEVSYSNNTNAGKGTVTVTGKGIYSGTVKAYFTIEPKSIKGMKAKLSKTSLVWNGKARKPSVTVGKLVKGTDFSVRYTNNRNVGKAKATIAGKGNYTGTIKKTFKINPKKAAGRKPARGKKKITVMWKKQALKMSKSRITGYQVQIATNKKFTKNKKSVKVKGYKKTSKVFKNLKAKKDYFVRVRTYKTVNGVPYYSSWSKVRSVKTR